MEEEIKRLEDFTRMSRKFIFAPKPELWVARCINARYRMDGSVDFVLASQDKEEIERLAGEYAKLADEVMGHKDMLPDGLHPCVTRVFEFGEMFDKVYAMGVSDYLFNEDHWNSAAFLNMTLKMVDRGIMGRKMFSGILMDVGYFMGKQLRAINKVLEDGAE